MNMTEGTPFRLILRFALPLLCGNILQQTYSLADAAIVGRYLGTDALAAVGCSVTLQGVVLGFCIGTGTGFTILVGQQFGAGDYSNMRRYIHHGNVLGIVIAAVFTVLFTTLSGLILTWMQVPEEIYADAGKYLFIIFCGIPFSLFYNYLAGQMRAVGDSGTPFVILCISTVLNIFMDLFCIIVLGWGCAGAAIATVFSQAFSGTMCFFAIRRKSDILILRPEDRKFSREMALRQIIVGCPMGLQYSITSIGGMILQSANNALGTVYISAYAACGKILTFLICPFDAFATGVATYAAQNFGAGKPERIRSGLLQGYVIGLIYGVLAGLVMVFAGRSLSMIILTADAAAELDAAQLYLLCNGIPLFLLAFLNISRQTTQGMGYSGWAVFSGAVELVCRVAISFVMVPAMGFTAVALTNGITWFFAALYITPTCFLCIRKASRVLKTGA